MLTKPSILTKDIKADTSAIREDTAELKTGQEQILAKLEELHAGQLPQNVRDNSHANFVIQRYLCSFESYAGSTSDEAKNWDEEKQISRSRESSLQRDPVPTENDEPAFISEPNRSGSGQNPFSDSNYGRASSFSSSQSFESSFQDHPPLEMYPTTSPRRSIESSLTTEDLIDLSDPIIPEGLTTLSLEGKNKTDSLISIVQISSNESQTTPGQRSASTTVEESGQYFNPTAALQLVDTNDSKNAVNLKRKTRTTIPVPSGNWILGDTIGEGKTGKVRMVKNPVTNITVSQLRFDKMIPPLT